jgi:formate hydrogenlyase transcriptional activator
VFANVVCCPRYLSNERETCRRPLLSKNGAQLSLNEGCIMMTLPDPVQPALPSDTSRLSQAILSCSIEQILPSIESALQRVMPHDYAAITFRDTNDEGRLRQRALLSPFDSASVRETIVPARRTPPGWVLAQQRPLLISKLDHNQFALPQDLAQARIRFGCWIPLICQEEAVGVLLVGSRDDAQLEQRVVDLLALGPQIAGALEIAETFQQITAFTDQLRDEKSYLTEQLQKEWKFESLIGMSAGFRSVIEQVRTAAATQQPVLIKGEIGTEKELIARLMHQLSTRRREIFIKVDCREYPPHILTGKLFGYEKKGPASSSSPRLGWLELAHHGTLFLEEVNALSMELQSRLLSAIQDKQLVSSEVPARPALDIRLIASTTSDLAPLVQSGRFNSHLNLLLASTPIQLPPLRERATDIPLLVNYLVARFATRMNKTINRIPEETMALLTSGQWPGNLRELENVIERAVLLTTNSTLHALTERDVSGEENLQAIERTHILRILRDTRGVIGGPDGAAERLGIKRTTLNSRLKKLGIERSTHKVNCRVD